MNYENGDIVKVKTYNANGREMPIVCIVDTEEMAYVSLLDFEKKFELYGIKESDAEFLGKAENLQEYHLNDKPVPEYVENYREYMKRKPAEKEKVGEVERE